MVVKIPIRSLSLASSFHLKDTFTKEYLELFKDPDVYSERKVQNISLKIFTKVSVEFNLFRNLDKVSLCINSENYNIRYNSRYTTIDLSYPGFIKNTVDIEIINFIYTNKALIKTIDDIKYFPLSTNIAYLEKFIKEIT